MKRVACNCELDDSNTRRTCNTELLMLSHSRLSNRRKVENDKATKSKCSAMHIAMKKQKVRIKQAKSVEEDKCFKSNIAHMQI